MDAGLTLSEGRPAPLGSTVDADGVNFALFSANAEKVELCLFDPRGTRETARLALPARTGDIWHGHLPGGKAGLLYGYRVYGPYEPLDGHRFNPNKVLIDPCARALDRSFVWNDIHCGYTVGDPQGDLSFDGRDNAALVPKGRVVGPMAGTTGTNPRTEAAATVLYELHVRGHTMRHPRVPAPLRGSFAGLAQSEIIRHIRDLGISAVELLPIHPSAMSRRLHQQDLAEYWGYNSINFFAPEPRYLAGGDVAEFRDMVRAFHDAGIAVILDVVFNHSGEGNELGPTLSFRGIDNASYYCLAADRRHYLDVTGCKNTLNLTHPQVVQMAMDSLRYWAETMGVDGFRFDLAVTLAREGHHFAPAMTFFRRLLADDVLSKTRLIVEPWDLGVDGYHLGGFPAGMSEWNDQYRDTVRRFWRGDDGMVGALASRLAGSSDLFSARGPEASVNYVTSHDGFTLDDLVSYALKHNAMNGEGNRDGTDENFSANYGIEGPTDTPAITALRARQKRNVIATLLLSQGMPMLLAGDELGRSQRGNNNPYCQDNDISWLDWEHVDESLLAFVRRLVRLRTEHPTFRRATFFHGDGGDGSGARDITWLTQDGGEMREDEWRTPGLRTLGALYAANEADAAFLLLMHAGTEAVPFKLPAPPAPAWRWRLEIETGEHRPAESERPTDFFLLAGRSLALFSANADA